MNTPINVTTLLAKGLGSVAEAVEVWALGFRSFDALPKTLTTKVTLPGTSGQVVQSPAGDLKNTRFPFYVEEIHAWEDAGTASGWLFELSDRDRGRLIGGPARAPGTILTTFNGRSNEGGLLRGHLIKPGGGLELTAQSAGTANDIWITVRGWWARPRSGAAAGEVQSEVN